MVDKRGIVLGVSIVVALLLAQFLIFVPTGSVVWDLEADYSLNEKLVGQVGIVIEDGDLIQKDTEVILSLSKGGESLSEVSMSVEEFINGQVDYVEVSEIIENCQRSIAENQTTPNCINETITNYFYNVPGNYIRKIEDLISYTFNEEGSYVLSASIPRLDLIEEITFSIVEEEVSVSSSRESSGERGILAVPLNSIVFVNSTNGNNYTSESLICWANATDADGDNITYSGFWYKNGEQQFDELNASIDFGSSDNSYSVAIDSNDDFVLTGAAGVSNDIWTVKFNSSGSQLWNRTKVGGGGKDVIIDSQDNVLVVGSVYDDNNNFYLVKYNASGSELWNKTIDSGGDEISRSVAVDNQDNIVMSGEISGSGIWTVKFNSSGSQLWNQTFNVTGTEQAYGVAVDSQDNIVLGGSYSEGGEARNGLVIKYNLSGSQLWNQTLNNSITDYFYDVAVDSQDNILLGGRTTIYSHSEFWTVKLNSSGSELWNKTMYSGSSNILGKAVVVDSKDNVIITGYRWIFSSPYAWTIKYNSSGNYLLNKTGQRSFGEGVAIDSQDNIIIAISNNDYFLAIKYYGFSLENQIEGSLVNVSTLRSGNTSKLENWSCEVKAFDGQNYSSYAISSNFTVLNFPPSQSPVFINSSLGTNLTNENLTCWANATDEDGDALSYNGFWYKNGVQNLRFDSSPVNYTQGTLVNISTLASSSSSMLENWSCQVRANDGENNGSYGISGNLTVLEVINIFNASIVYPVGNVNVDQGQLFTVSARIWCNSTARNCTNIVATLDPIPVSSNYDFVECSVTPTVVSNVDWWNTATDVYTGRVYGQEDDGGFIYQLPWEFSLAGENYVNVTFDTNTVLQLYKAGEDIANSFSIAYGWTIHSDGTYVTFGDNGTYIWIANVDFKADSDTGGQITACNEGDKVAFTWNGTTYNDRFSSERYSEFQVVLYENGNINWNFNIFEYSSFNEDNFTGISYYNVSAPNDYTEIVIDGVLIAPSEEFSYSYSVIPIVVNSMNTSSNNAGVGSSVSCNANVTSDTTTIRSVSFNITFPNSSILSLGAGVQNGDLWASEEFITGVLGTYTCTVLATDNESSIREDSTTFTVGNPGIIPMNSGTPFFTTSQNPTNGSYDSCLSTIGPGEYCDITWEVNASGEEGMWEFFAYFEGSYAETNSFNVTIAEEEDEDDQGEDEDSNSFSGFPVYVVDELELEEGYAQNLVRGGRIEFTFNEKDYNISVDNFEETYLSVFISGMEEVMFVGDIIKLDLDGDGEYYDLAITLNDITFVTRRADLTIKYIEELIAEEEAPQIAEQFEKEEGFNFNLEIIIIFVAIILIIIVQLIFRKKK